MVASDPIDATATIFPDGTYFMGDSSLCGTDAGFRDRVRDLRFILDAIAEWRGQMVLGTDKGLCALGSAGFTNIPMLIQ